MPETITHETLTKLKTAGKMLDNASVPTKNRQALDQHGQKIKHRKTRGKVDVDKALKLKIDNNLSYAQIAELQNVTPNAIFKQIRHLLPTQDTHHFKHNRADILAGLQLKLLSQVDDKRLKKISPAQAVLAACQLYDKERLERGQSTENITQIHADIAKIRGYDENKYQAGDE